jgi:outer membrane protein
MVRVFRLLGMCCLLNVHTVMTGQQKPLLTLDEAVALALRNNRPVKSAVIDIAKYDDKIAQTRTKKLPAFSFSAEAGVLLSRLDFVFDRGVFGTFPGIGPVPASNTDIRTPISLTSILITQVTQPISQLYKIRLGLQQLQAGKELAQEQVRTRRQALADNVRQAYYAILSTQSALEDQTEQIKLYREMDRTTTQYLLQQVVLKSESLDVKARLGKAEYDLLTMQDTLASGKEQLNLLLGRDIRGDFDTMPISTDVTEELDLAAAQARALAGRPEIHQARLQLKQADLDRRITKAERIPDVAATIRDISPLNYGKLVPGNIPTAGLSFSWEPFDWGRKKRELSEKEHGVEQATLAVQEVENQVLLDVNSKYRKLAEARQAVTVAQLAQATARENLRVATDTYKEQATLLKTVLQAQSSVADANHRYQQAMLAVWSAKADLEKALGEE